MKHIKKFNALNDVLVDCQPFISELKKCVNGNLDDPTYRFLTRGFDSEFKNILKFKSRLLNRKPSDTPKEVHDYLNKLFYDKFGWSVRNGVFSIYGDYGQYSKYIVMPIGDYEIVWSDKYYDLYNKLSSMLEYDTIEYTLSSKSSELKSIVDTYKEGDLNAAMNSGNEISIKCDSYYLIPISYKEELIKLIWNDEKI
jgi:hypothetical protein